MTEQTYKYSKKSKDKLKAAHPDLRAVFERAIEITEVDFSIFEVKRTAERQMEYFKHGVSKLDGVTRKSKHQPNEEDGLVYAVDAVPYIMGSLRWEWPPIYIMASAIHQAALELGVRLRWGAVWDRPFTDLGGSPAQLEAAVRAYTLRRYNAGKRVFLDGPHFELLP